MQNRLSSCIFAMQVFKATVKGKTGFIWLLTILILSGFSTGAWAQVPIAYFDFESNSSRSDLTQLQYSAETNVGYCSEIARENNTVTTGRPGAGLTLYSGSAAGTAISGLFTVGGNVNANAATEYFQFTVNKAGLQDLAIQFDQRIGTSGPGKLGVFCTIDGGATRYSLGSANGSSAGWSTSSIELNSALTGGNKTTVNNANEITFYIYPYNVSTGQNSVASERWLAIDNLLVSASTIASSVILLDENVIAAGVTSGGTTSFIRSNLTINGTGTTVTINNPINIASTTVNEGATLDISNNLTGTSLTVTGTNAVVNSNKATSFTGTTTVSTGGTLNISDVFAAGALSISGTGSVANLNGPTTISGASTIGTGTILNANNTLSGTSFNVTGAFNIAGSVTPSTGVTVNSGGSVKFADAASKITGSGSFSLSSGGNLEIASPLGLTSTAGSGNIQVTGSRTYNSAAHYKYIANSIGSIESGNQLPATISGSITVNLGPNTNNPVSFTNASTTLSGTLYLSSGRIKTSNANKLIMPGTSTINGGSSNSFIDGPMIYSVATTVSTTLTFHIGKDNAYRKVVLTVKHNSNASTLYTAEQTTGSHATLPLDSRSGFELDNVSGVRYFTVSKGGGASVASATITLSYDADDYVNDPTKLRIAKTNAAANEWVNIGRNDVLSSNTTTGVIVSNSFTEFSDFILANAKGGANSLPVTLSSFTAARKGADAVLNWTTATEKNNKGFEVEVSANGIEFRPLGFVASKNSNSTTVQVYNFTDFEIYKTNARYYRLKQTDFDGTTWYSGLKEVEFGKAKADVTVYPNPVEQNFTVTVMAKATESGTVEITDALGRLVHTLPVQLQQGNNTVQIQLPGSCQAGVYTVTLKTAGAATYHKIIRN